jgi:hypothetical protein
MRSRFEITLSSLAYGYVLRVPILVCLSLLALPFVAIPTDAIAGPLLRGLFDITDQSAPAGGASFAQVVVAFALVTVLALMAAATIWVTASLIVADGEERFGLRPVEKSAGTATAAAALPTPRRRRCCRRRLHSEHRHGLRLACSAHCSASRCSCC